MAFGLLALWVLGTLGVLPAVILYWRSKWNGFYFQFLQETENTKNDPVYPDSVHLRGKACSRKKENQPRASTESHG